MDDHSRVNGTGNGTGGGTLDDEVLRRAVEERMRNMDVDGVDGEEEGMHL